MTVVAREHFNLTDISVAAQMANIKSSGAQALIAWSTGTPVATIEPSRRFFPSQQSTTTEAGISTLGFGQVVIAATGLP